MDPFPEDLVAKARDAHLAAKTRVRFLKEGLAEQQAEQEAALQVNSFITETAKAVQENVHASISKTVSRCLEAVFDNPYEFRIVFERKRGRTEARLAFFRDGHEYDPQEDVGGGVVDVAAFALRLACLLAKRPAGRRLLVLDEPFRWLSEHGQYRERVRALLETLAREMELQIVMVTHDSTLECGTVVSL